MAGSANRFGNPIPHEIACREAFRVRVRSRVTIAFCLPKSGRIRACLTGLLDSQAFISLTPFCMANATKEPATAQASTKPVQKFRLRGVSVSVFENSAKTKDREVTFYKVAIQRSYRDNDGEWQNTTSFGRDDLPVLGLLLKQAWQYILEAEASRGKDDDADEE